MPVVYIGCPTYGEEINTGAATGITVTATNRDDVSVIPGFRSSSLIPGSCNVLWCDALNNYEAGRLDYFVMLHADISPESFWLDKLLDIIERTGADMVSACVPIKDERGVTSTAIASADYRTQFCRITQRQLWHPDFPETFDIDQAADALERLPGDLQIPTVPRFGLRLNTGCMIVRMSPVVATGSVYFENLDWIERKPDGKWRQRDVSEDWRFSQKVQDAGGKLVATRAVMVIHKGIAGFPNDKAWGSVESDASILTAQAAA